MTSKKTIYAKLSDKTKDNEKMQEFLGKLITFENSSKSGWYKDKYNEFLNEQCKEGES